ncbi:MAG TPA: succinyldiaminopimelate transaminase [Micromonosporaceae bacterium]
MSIRASGLPDFPWDLLEPAKAKAAAHPDGIVDLSIGTPVDPVPKLIRDALTAAADAPGYPLTAGTPALRAAITAWVRSACHAAPGFDVMPTIGSKELVAWLPTLLGLGAGDVVVIPSVCYPTYEVGALLAGAAATRSDRPWEAPPAPGTKLVWINSPGNPHGAVLPIDDLRAAVAWAREHRIVLASDECYLSLGWDAVPVSVLEACDGDFTGLLAVHSLSKRSNLAGYRAGFVAGDPALVRDLLAVRKHGGMIVPAPVQAAMIAALGDEQHVEEQRERYEARRSVLRPALERAGFTIDGSEAGLYLWSRRDADCWAGVDWLAERGILAAPGTFYGPAGASHVRLALTATDERIAAAVARLTSTPGSTSA